MAKNERNWYDAMPAIGVDYNDAESKDGVEVAVKQLDVSDLTAKEIEEKVESGELDSAEVYEAEKRGKQRKGVLEAYAPKE